MAGCGRVGFETVLPTGAQPTLAIALGGIGLRLQDLATLYADLANGGRATPLVYTRDRPARPGPRLSPRLLSPVAAWYVTDILKDAPPPVNARGGRIAYKTGTSYGYRDAWAIGYDGRHVIAVWVGRADGSARRRGSAVASPRPLLFDAFARVAERVTRCRPRRLVCACNHRTCAPLRLLRWRGRSPRVCYAEPIVRIAFPPDRADWNRTTARQRRGVEVRVGAAADVVADGAPINSDPQQREVMGSRPDALHAHHGDRCERQKRRVEIRLK